MRAESPNCLSFDTPSFRLLPVRTVVFFLLVVHDVSLSGSICPTRISYRALAEAKASSEYLALNSNVDSSDNRCLICLLHFFFYFKLYIYICIPFTKDLIGPHYLSTTFLPLWMNTPCCGRCTLTPWRL